VRRVSCIGKLPADHVSLSQGACTVDPNTNEGTCACVERPILNPDSSVPYQVSRDGAACTCPVPLLPPDGYESNGNIVARFCNGHGNCCPFGERQQDEKIDGDYSG